MIRKFRCTNIDWDVDEEDEADELPTCQNIEVNIPENTPDYELDDIIGDELTKLFGYCHNGFRFVEI